MGDPRTQICVLGHITTQIEAVRNGAPTDMIFQSIAGSQKGNTAFGFSAETVREAQALLAEKGTASGPNVLYFETGQGSELSSNAHHGADQVTMEARCYGFAKAFHPFMVNTVVGFIGRNTCTTAVRSSAPDWRTISWKAHRRADGLRLLLHQPHAGRPERH